MVYEENSRALLCALAEDIIDNCLYSMSTRLTSNRTGKNSLCVPVSTYPTEHPFQTLNKLIL